MGWGGRGTPAHGDASLSTQHLQPLGDYGIGSPTWAWVYFKPLFGGSEKIILCCRSVFNKPKTFPH